MPSLETTNMWLAILATAAAIQTFLLVGAVVAVFRVYQRTIGILAEFERSHLTPITARVTHALDELEDLSARARRVDDNVREGVQSANKVVWAMASKAWPLLGAARAVQAGLRVFQGRGREQNVENGKGDRVATFERRRTHVS